MVDLSGGCNCGATRYRITSAAKRVSHCHCTICRRAGGAVAGTFATFDAAAVTWQGAEPRLYRSSDFAFRRFCGACGSQLAFGYDALPELVSITVGTLDSPELTPAERHDFAAERIPWVQLDAQLPATPRWWDPPPGKE
ncbi:MAG TPA: GFA family protein [Alphaproteobacteria bacterium]